MIDLDARKPRPQIGLLPTGHFSYWDQFPKLKEMGQRMYGKLVEQLEEIGDVVAPELVDTREKAVEAGEFFRRRDIDILLVFPFGYTPGMCVLPAVEKSDVPIRIVNGHEDSTYDYKNADTTVYLHHEGVCCIPEYCAGLRRMGKKFKVRTGHFGDERLWREIAADCLGAAAARVFRQLSFGIIGDTYTNMVDMPTDEHRYLKATGKLLIHPEVEEIEEAFNCVTEEQHREMLEEIRDIYDVDETVTDEQMELSVRIAVAYDQVICRHDIHAFGYYWWGQKELITTLRSESAIAVSRLASLGRPGVTEGDVKTAMAMKILDLLGAGGMFVEFFSMDFDEQFILMGHDGPGNINMRQGKARLTHLEVHHGKSGHGLGIDFDVHLGPVTLVNLTQFDEGSDSFKLIYTRGEVIPGDILAIGNPNCRVRVERPIHEFVDAWCQEGPSHHIALGSGDRGEELEAFAEGMGFDIARI